MHHLHSLYKRKCICDKKHKTYKLVNTEYKGISINVIRNVIGRGLISDQEETGYVKLIHVVLKNGKFCIGFYSTPKSTTSWIVYNELKVLHWIKDCKFNLFGNFFEFNYKICYITYLEGY